MKIRQKIFFLVLIPSMIIFVLSLSFLSIKYRDLTIYNSTVIADLYASQAANTTETMLVQDLSTVKTLRDAFLSYNTIEKNFRNVFYNSILKNVLLNNKEYLSVWMSWELKHYSDDWLSPYGRNRIATLKEKSGVSFFVDSADIEGDDLSGMYYKLKSGEYEEVITDPYLYTYSDEDTSTSFFETTIASAIVQDEVFAGVVGIDVSLERFQNIIDQIAPFDESFVFIVANNGTIVAHPNRNFQGKLLSSTYIRLNKDSLKHIENGEAFQGFTKNQYDEDVYMSFVPINVGKTKSPWAIGMIVPRKVILADAKENFNTSMIIVVLVTLFVSFVMMAMYSRITNPLRKTTKILVELERGNIQKLDKINISSKDELGVMAKSVNNLIDSLNSTADFAKKIGKGDLTATYQLLSNEDVLGNALLEMQKNLSDAKESEEKQQKENDRLSWTQNGITQINEILRLENETLEQLTFSITTFLIKYLNANQGGFYVIDDDDKDNIHIRLVSSYAFDRKKQLEALLQIGEGLVGRCVKEKEVIYITNLPDGFMYITSGLGDRTPNVLLISPLIFEENIFGVIEIASFNEIDDYKRFFIQEACERIASSISNIKKNVRTNELLKKSQAQADKLNARENEFDEKLKELDTIQKDVSIKSKETKELLNAITKKIALTEYLPDGTITNIINNSLLSTGENLHDLIGKNQKNLASEAKESIEWYNQFWDDLRKGKMRKRKFIFEKNSKKYYFDETYIPVRNLEGEIYKILNFGIDITENEELKERFKNLTSEKEY
jgi:methyl-accepting chemotaxis protein